MVLQTELHERKRDVKLAGLVVSGISKTLAVEFDSLGVFLVPHITDEHEKEKMQDVAPPAGAVYEAAAQDVGGFPEMGLQRGKWDRHGDERSLLYGALFLTAEYRRVRKTADRNLSTRAKTYIELTAAPAR